MLKSSDKSLGKLTLYYLAPFGHNLGFMVTSIFISIKYDGVKSFARIKN